MIATEGRVGLSEATCVTCWPQLARVSSGVTLLEGNFLEWQSTSLRASTVSFAVTVSFVVVASIDGEEDNEEGGGGSGGGEGVEGLV